MSFPPEELHPDAIRFLTEPRVIASFATTRKDGRPHVASVGYTYDPVDAIVRVVTKPFSQKVRNVEAGSSAALNQIDGMLWIQLQGPARVLHDPASLADAYERFAARYGRVHEGEELTGRAMRDKGVAPGGAPAKASERRGTRKAGQKVAPAPDSRTLPSPIQALKASVKKAAGRKKSSRAGKSRR